MGAEGSTGDAHALQTKYLCRCAARTIDTVGFGRESVVALSSILQTEPLRASETLNTIKHN